jgi:uncharacterized protein YjbI with pentapeptide repeats
MVAGNHQDKANLERVSQKELDEIIKKHHTFLKGIRGGARAVIKFKDMSELNFRSCDLSQADLTGSILLGANLSGGTFKGVSFFACDLRNARLENANFTRADFRGAFVAGANLTGADLKDADLREGKVMERGDKGTLTQKATSPTYRESAGRTIFTGAKLTETDMSGARAAAADFSDADLSGVIVKDADFSGVNFEGANLSDADFTGSVLTNANLKSSIMSGTVLAMTETGGANLSEALTDVAIGSTLDALEKTLAELLEEHTAWIASAGKKGKRLDLSGYDMRAEPKLKTYPLTAIKAVGANFLAQDLQGLEAQSALLDRADFRDCKMQGADLRGSSFKHALFSRADLSDANLSPLQFAAEGGATRLQRVNLSGANLRYCILRGANLCDAIMMGVDLSYAVLIDCDLRRADLTGAILTGADLTDCLMSGTIVEEKYRAAGKG